jgi:hypothetical protein
LAISVGEADLEDEFVSLHLERLHPQFNLGQGILRAAQGFANRVIALGRFIRGVRERRIELEGDWLIGGEVKLIRLTTAR